MRAPLHGAIALAAMALASCADADNWSPEKLLRGTTVAEQERLARGRDSYTTYCAGCHGEDGDGQGPAARFLDPKPRDFTKGKVKLASVPAGEMPTDADLARAITRGLQGTSMPAWHLLPKNEVDDLVAYIKTFTPNRKPPGAIVPIPQDPWSKSPERGVAEGEKVYHGLAACHSCHPAYVTKPKLADSMKAYDLQLTGFRDRLYESEAKESEWGELIRPPDFLQDRVKSGTDRNDLARVIAAGVGGTAMPSWGATLTAKQLWGLAYYVESLALKRGTAEAAEIMRGLIEQPAFAVPPPPPPPAAAPSAEPSASAAPSASTSASPK
jgi:mono/diheme cytochrome c family protein